MKGKFKNNYKQDNCSRAFERPRRRRESQLKIDLRQQI